MMLLELYMLEGLDIDKSDPIVKISICYIFIRTKVLHSYLALNVTFTTSKQ